MKSYHKFTVRWLLLLTCLSMSCRPDEPDRPNFVLIMADDLGYGDIGCYGNTRIETPHLDRMAAEGLLFTDYHSNGAVCTPTRAALLTGRYQQRAGLEGVIYVRGETRSTGMDPREYTIAESLKEAGYATGIVGKWHLGYDVEYNPVHQGFDYFRGYVSGNIDYISHYDGAGIADWWHDTTRVEEGGYVTDLIGKYSEEFIRAHADTPFFLYVAHEAPHWPYQGRDDPADRKPGVEFPMRGSREDQAGAYKEMVEIMDQTVGAVIACLEQLDLAGRTFVVFCSDNGGVPQLGDNGMWRGHKGTLWEGGHRVPAIAWCPDIAEAGQYAQPIISMDWCPTFLRLAGTPVQQPVIFDGQDISQVLTTGDALDRRPLFWKYRDQGAVRLGRWKWIRSNGRPQLFDLSKDPAEGLDLATERPDVADSLTVLFDTWYREVTQGVPQRTR